MFIGLNCSQVSDVIHGPLVFAWGFRTNSRIFHSYVDVTITGEGLQILSYAPLIAIERWGFLACYTYCVTGHPFIMVISEDPWHSHLLPSVWQCSCFYLFLHFCCGWYSNSQPSCCGANALTDCATAAAVK